MIHRMVAVIIEGEHERRQLLNGKSGQYVPKLLLRQQVSMAVILALWTPDNRAVFDYVGQIKATLPDRPPRGLQRSAGGNGVSDTLACHQVQSLRRVGRDFRTGVE